MTNRAVYEKGKGDCYRLFNMQSTEAALVLEKKKNIELTWQRVPKISEASTSCLYILNKAKEKMEVIKL